MDYKEEDKIIFCDCGHLAPSHYVKTNFEGETTCLHCYSEYLKELLTLSKRYLFSGFITWYNPKPDKPKNGLLTLTIINEYLKFSADNYK